MMAPPTLITVAIKSGSSLSSSSSSSSSPWPSVRSGRRRNALADVTAGIAASQLRALEQAVQTYVPDFFSPDDDDDDDWPAPGSGPGSPSGSPRRNAVADVTQGLTPADLRYLACLGRTHRLSGLTARGDADSEWETDSSTDDGEVSCRHRGSRPHAGPHPAYYGRRRNALAEPLPDLDLQTLERIRHHHNCRDRS